MAHVYFRIHFMLEGDTPTLCLKGNSWGIGISLACSSPYCLMFPCTDKDSFLSLPTFLQANLHFSMVLFLPWPTQNCSALYPSLFTSKWWTVNLAALLQYQSTDTALTFHISLKSGVLPETLQLPIFRCSPDLI